MISVAEAYKRISSYKKDYGTEKVELLQAINRMLAIDITADRDFPPFDRVTMDGIAIQSEAFATGQRNFRIENISAAGSHVLSLSNNEHCIEVMTGTVLPQGTDAVIPYEQCNIRDGFAEINSTEIKPFQNIHQQGKDEKKGAVLLRKNSRITAAYISIMATVGVNNVEVYKMPAVAICSTGDELVPVSETPLLHQIRQSNAYFIAADLIKENIQPTVHHLPDNKETMKEKLQSLLQKNDVILLSGAVSKGKFDFLPHVLAELGMETVFHNINQRPGKPLLFGNIGDKLVFGFPGNPLSTFVCYHLFFKHWLRQSMHQTDQIIEVQLSGDLPVQASLVKHVLVRIKYNKGNCFAEPIPFSTSGDIPSLINADGIITFPEGRTLFEKGEVFEVVLCK